MDENKIPVIVGVGQINDREERLTSMELMAAALQNADADGGGGWLGRADALDVVAQLSFPEFKDASAPLAQMLEIAPRHCAQTRYPMGDSPVALLNTAANRIASGEAEVCAIAGGEALRTAAKRAAGGKRDAVRDSAARATREGRARYGIVAPTDVYPFYENACRAAWGQPAPKPWRARPCRARCGGHKGIAHCNAPATDTAATSLCWQSAPPHHDGAAQRSKPTPQLARVLR